MKEVYIVMYTDEFGELSGPQSVFKDKGRAEDEVERLTEAQLRSNETGEIDDTYTWYIRAVHYYE